jgi:hypothetical protein
MKKINISIFAIVSAVLIPWHTAQAGPNTGLIDVSGVAATSSAPVSGAVGSGTSRKVLRNQFSPEMQAKMERVELSLDSISGSQQIGDFYLNVDPVSVELLLEVINSPAGSTPEALPKLVASLGGGSPAQSLAESLLGLRDRRRGNIDAAVLINAVNAYNAYMGSLHASAINQLPTSELDGYVRSLPEGQQAVQVLLTKLLAN